MRSRFRCASCYTQLDWDFQTETLTCPVCEFGITVQRIAGRTRLRMLWDYITGLEDARH